MTPAVSPWRTTQPTRSRATASTSRAKYSGGIAGKLCAGVGELLADAVERRPALGDLRLEPRALGEHVVVLLVEHVRVPAHLLERELGEPPPRGHRRADEAGHDAVRLPERD